MRIPTPSAPKRSRTVLSEPHYGLKAARPRWNAPTKTRRRQARPLPVPSRRPTPGARTRAEGAGRSVHRGGQSCRYQHAHTLATSDVDPATRSTPFTTSLLSNCTASPRSRLIQAIAASPSTSPPSPVLVEGKKTSTLRSSNNTVDCRHFGGHPRTATRLTTVGSDRALALRIRNRFAPLRFDLPQQGCTLRHSALGQRE